MIINDDLIGKLEWLRTHKDPYEEVKENWDATYDVRLTQLRQEGGSVNDYFMEYGALQLATGYKLVSVNILPYIYNNIDMLLLFMYVNIYKCKY